MDYATYIKSDKWKRKKSAFWRAHPKVCRSCGSKESLHLHHATYDRLGDERFEDLVPLCDSCHIALHQMHKDFEDLSLQEFANEFLAMNRSKQEPEILTQRQLNRLANDKKIRARKKIKAWRK
jgi:hypothetical protein